MVAQIEICLRIHHLSDTVAYIVPADVSPGDGGVACANDFCEAFLFIALRLRDNKSDVHVAVGVHSLGKSIACSAETSENMWGEFPSEH